MGGIFMIKRYAIVVDFVVVNIAVAEHPIAQNWIESDVAGIGWSYVNGVFSPASNEVRP